MVKTLKTQNTLGGTCGLGVNPNRPNLIFNQTHKRFDLLQGRVVTLHVLSISVISIDISYIYTSYYMSYSTEPWFSGVPTQYNHQGFMCGTTFLYWKIGLRKCDEFLGVFGGRTSSQGCFTYVNWASYSHWACVYIYIDVYTYILLLYIEYTIYIQIDCICLSLYVIYIYAHRLCWTLLAGRFGLNLGAWSSR